MYHKLVILFDAFLISVPTAVLGNCLETAGLKPSQYLLFQIEVSFICSTGIFSDRETLEILAASISFEDLLPRLTFTWF